MPNVGRNNRKGKRGKLNLTDEQRAVISANLARAREIKFAKRRSDSIGGSLGVVSQPGGEATTNGSAAGVDRVESVGTEQPVFGAGESHGSAPKRDSDGRGTGRGRGYRRSRTGAGAGKRTGAGAEETAKSDKSSDFRIDIDDEPRPRKTRGTKKAPTTEEKQISKAAMIGLVAAGWVALFGVVARVRREPHWDLERDEALIIAQSFLAMVETFPGNIYAKFEIIIKYVLPSVSFCLTTFAIVERKISESNRLRAEKANYREARGDDSGATEGYQGAVNGLGGPNYSQSW